MSFESTCRGAVGRHMSKRGGGDIDGWSVERRISLIADLSDDTLKHELRSPITRTLPSHLTTCKHTRRRFEEKNTTLVMESVSTTQLAAEYPTLAALPREDLVALADADASAPNEALLEATVRTLPNVSEGDNEHLALLEQVEHAAGTHTCILTHAQHGMRHVEASSRHYEMRHVALSYTHVPWRHNGQELSVHCARLTR